MANSHGPMAVNTKDNSKKTTYTEKVLMFGTTTVSLQESGKTIKCMVMAYSPGLTGVNSKATTTLTKKRDQEYFIGQMERRSKGPG